MDARLFWAAWGPLCVWRRRHALRMRCLARVEARSRAFQIALLEKVFAAWCAEVPQRFGVLLPLYLPLALSSRPVLEPVWAAPVSWGAGFVLAFEVADDADDADDASPPMLLDVPWAEVAGRLGR